LIRFLKKPYGQTENAEPLKELQKSLRHCRYLLENLEYSTKGALHCRLANRVGELPAKTDQIRFFSAFLDWIGSGESAVQDMLQHQVFREKADPRMNWRAVAIAKYCREIWAREEFLSKPEKYGPAPTEGLGSSTSMNENFRKQEKSAQADYHQHIQEFAPKTQHPDRPGPFGRLLEDIFQTMGVLSPS